MCPEGARVFLAYAAPRGRAFLDRELYLPKEWANDPARREAAGVPAETVFQTKPALARVLLARAFAAGVPAAWVTGDEVYGRDRRLRLWLEEQERPFVLAVATNESLWARTERGPSTWTTRERESNRVATCASANPVLQRTRSLTSTIRAALILTSRLITSRESR